MNVFALTNLSVGISCVILSFFILYSGKTALHRILLAFNIVVSVWGFGLFIAGISQTSEDALLGWKIAHLGGFLVAPTFYHLISEFCQIQRQKTLRLVYLQAVFFVLVSIILPGLLFTGTRFLYGIHYLKANSVFTFGMLLYFFFVILSFYELSRFLLKAKGHLRLQSQYIVFGFLFGFTGAAFIFPPMYGVEILYPFTNVGITIYCLVLAYAILRHRLMDIQIIVRECLIYTLAAGFLATCFLVLVLLMSTFLPDVLGWSFSVITVFAAIIIAFLFNPVIGLFQRLTNMLLYRKASNYSETIKKISSDLVATIELKQVCRHIVVNLFENLKTGGVYLLQREEDTFELACFESEKMDTLHPAEDPHWSLSRRSPLVSVLLDRKETVIKDEIIQLCIQSQVESIEDSLAPFQGKVVVPVFLDDDLEFLIILGDKISGSFYTLEDLNFLDTVANQSAIALKNAKLFADLNEAYKFLAQEINERAHIQNELSHREEIYRTLVESAPF